jgi:hemerythrin-like metal-binding protein
MLNKLIWDEKYSVGVQIIDNQHKEMFKTINELIETLEYMPSKEQVDKIIESLIAYKKFHFATEEKYFAEFGYEGGDEHIAKHNEFSDKLEKLTVESKGDSVDLAFKLVDFLEDWLIDHLMITDQKYVECFKGHGLK